jgi:hypothetical protein
VGVERGWRPLADQFHVNIKPAVRRSFKFKPRSQIPSGLCRCGIMSCVAVDFTKADAILNVLQLESGPSSDTHWLDVVEMA